jgi:hypothetical protein
VTSSHLHVVLRNRPYVLKQWSDEDVALSWQNLRPQRRDKDGSPAEPAESDLNHLKTSVRERRLRLSSISWIMRCTSEVIARIANAEEVVSGQFWEGRFKAVLLPDEAAIAACMVYVDLNLIRAGIAETPETSNFTSVQDRMADPEVGSGSLHCRSAGCADRALRKRRLAGSRATGTKAEECTGAGDHPAGFQPGLHHSVSAGISGTAGMDWQDPPPRQRRHDSEEGTAGNGSAGDGLRHLAGGGRPYWQASRGQHGHSRHAPQCHCLPQQASNSETLAPDAGVHWKATVLQERFHQPLHLPKLLWTAPMMFGPVMLMMYYAFPNDVPTRPMRGSPPQRAPQAPHNPRS